MQHELSAMALLPMLGIYIGLPLRPIYQVLPSTYFFLTFGIHLRGAQKYRAEIIPIGGTLPST